MEVPCGRFNTSYAQDMAIVRTKTQWLLLLAFLFVLFFVIPNFVPSVWLLRLCFAGVAIVAVQGLNIITGYTGQISLGHSAFVGIGAYTSAILTTQLGLSFWLAVVVAGITAGLISILIGLPSLRVKGFYLALITIAFLYIFLWVIGPGFGLTSYPPSSPGMPSTIPYPSIGGFVFDSYFRMYFIIMGCVVLLTFFARNLARSKVGRAFVAIRDDEIAAETMGISLLRYKLLAFFIGCFYAGIAGALLAHLQGKLDATPFSLQASISYLMMLVVGGMGSTLGPVAGGLFFTLLQGVVLFLGTKALSAFQGLGGGFVGSATLVVTGLAVVLFFIFEPKGMANLWERFKVYYRRWPFSN